MEAINTRDRLVQAMIRCDVREFQRILSETDDLIGIIDTDNATSDQHAVFHELTLCIVGEDRLMLMMKHVETAFRSRYQEQWKDVLSNYLNIATKEDLRTPLHMATQNARMVRSHIETCAGVHRTGGRLGSEGYQWRHCDAHCSGTRVAVADCVL